MTTGAARHGAPVQPKTTAPAPRVQSASADGGAPDSWSADAGPKAASGKGLGPSLNETIQRVQVSWEASRASRDSVVSDVYAEMQRTKSLNGTSSNGSSLGKRASMGVFEDAQERKRRAVEGDAHDRRASAKWDPSAGTNGRDLKGSAGGTPSAPAAAANGASSADKTRDGAQVLRAVRSAPNKASSPGSKDAGPQALDKSTSRWHYRAYVGKNAARSHEPHLRSHWSLTGMA